MCSTLFYCVLHADCAMICPGTVAEVLIHSPMYQLSFFPLQCVSYSVAHAMSCSIAANYSSGVCCVQVCSQYLRRVMLGDRRGF